MNMTLRFLKKWVLPVIATLLSMLLLYIAQGYPCLKGAGLALADFEAFIFLVLIGLPCLIWATTKLLLRAGSVEQRPREDQWISRLAVIVIVLFMLYALLAIPVIFSFARHPLQFICR